MDSKGACRAVSDWCKTWDDKTGCCTSCFPGYGDPVNGVCSSTPPDVGEGNDDNCAEYGYVDSKNVYHTSWNKDCRKVCVECDDGYTLDSSYNCVANVGNDNRNDNNHRKDR